jgi:AmmeMemoRadiSam system protein B
MSIAAEVRPMVLAGTWYQGQPQRLAAAVDAYLAHAKTSQTDGKVIGLIAPHAGHRYSGWVAGHAFAAARNLTPRLVAVIGPMHHPYPYPLITSAHAFYQTPLGSLPVARHLLDDLSARLKDQLGFGLTPIANDPEHALEIQLPFLQRALAEPFLFIPIMLRQQDADTAQILGQTLAQTLAGQNCLLVASTDLSHFYNQPRAEKLDRALLQAAEAFDPAALFDLERRGLAEACGLGALATMFWAAKALGGEQVKILNYATSGSTSGDYERVVGYGAGVVLQGH